MGLAPWRGYRNHGDALIVSNQDDYESLRHDDELKRIIAEICSRM